MTLTHFDLFSGIGGFALAAEHSGFNTLGFAETDKFCRRVLRKHWPAVPQYGNVKNVGLSTVSEPITLLTGGFPCQPFSHAGKQQGKNDARHLWPQFNRIIQELHPAWIVAENVTGIVDVELSHILNDLARAGYETRVFNIAARAAGCPHQRNRALGNAIVPAVIYPILKLIHYIECGVLQND